MTLPPNTSDATCKTLVFIDNEVVVLVAVVVVAAIPVVAVVL